MLLKYRRWLEGWGGGGVAKGLYSSIIKNKKCLPPPEGEKFPVIALDYQHRRSASALFIRLYSKC